MNQIIPEPGELYTSKEDKLYQVLYIAKHVQTSEPLVICQLMQDAFEIYAIPLLEFSGQLYGLKKTGHIGKTQRETKWNERRSAPEPVKRKPIQAAAASEPMQEKQKSQFKKASAHGSATDELRANPHLLDFLDADTYEQKYQVLTGIGEDITNRLIDDMAVVLDVVIPEGDVTERYYQLKNIVLTRQKYETSRLR